MSTYGYSVRPAATHAPGLFGRVMGLVALTVGFATLGVYIARGWGGAGWFISWLLAIGCLIGLNAVNARGNTSLALVLLFAFGLLIGISVSATVNYGLYTVLDFNRLRRAGNEEAIPLAASIFLDVLNIFLFFLQLFGRSN